MSPAKHRKRGVVADIVVNLPGGRKGVLQETMAAGVWAIKTLSLIDTWFRADVIDGPMRDAAHAFAEDFRRAEMSPHYAHVSPDRVPGGGGDSDQRMARIAKARRRMQAAIEAVGETAGGILIDILGHEMSLSEAARRRAWAGRAPASVNLVKGALFAGLGGLAAHYRGEK